MDEKDLITQEQLKQLLHYDPETGAFTWLVTLGSRAIQGRGAGLTVDKQGRRTIRLEKRLYLAHRLAFLYVEGRWPSPLIDHINCDASDNRWCNLREATHSQNEMNRGTPKRKTEGTKGTWFWPERGMWVAYIRAGRIRKTIGYFYTQEEAAEAYAKAAKELHGEFART